MVQLSHLSPFKKNVCISGVWHAVTVTFSQNPPRTVCPFNLGKYVGFKCDRWPFLHCVCVAGIWLLFQKRDR
uniref:Uncharacterized protein n=1 Tax=Anguilla anguilla TaxID=7936 RepID=A0A0E9WC52_ANGAN